MYQFFLSAAFVSVSVLTFQVEASRTPLVTVSIGVTV